LKLNTLEREKIKSKALEYITIFILLAWLFVSLFILSMQIILYYFRLCFLPFNLVQLTFAHNNNQCNLDAKISVISFIVDIVCIQGSFWSGSFFLGEAKISKRFYQLSMHSYPRLKTSPHHISVNFPSNCMRFFLIVNFRQKSSVFSFQINNFFTP